MIAENKQEFFEQLERELQKLGVEDTGELMGDLEEHFAEGERRGVPEAETCRELGSISEIARSCLDLKSTAINSMVARDVQRKKGVSLTKPGRSVPADPSLAAPGQAATAEDVSGLPSYTPEHVSEEIYPNAVQSGTQVGAGIGSAAAVGAAVGAAGVGFGGAANVNGTAGTVGGVGGAANVSGTAGTVGGVGGAAGSSASTCGTGAANSSADGTSSGTGTANGSANTNGGTFEKVGKAVDVAFDKAGKALNEALGKAGGAVNGALGKAGEAVGAFRPSDSYREHVNNGRNGGEIPPQYTKVKGQGGSKFVDTSGLQPNVNGSRLACEILLDVFLWSWLIPTIFSLVVAAFGVAVGMIVWGVQCIIGHGYFGQFKFITRLLFMLGFFNLSAAVFCIAVQALKASIGLVKNVLARHIKAIYDI